MYKGKLAAFPKHEKKIISAKFISGTKNVGSFFCQGMSVWEGQEYVLSLT
jgi:hypothetical protein